MSVMGIWTKLALRVIGDRYSDEVLRLILSLNDNGNGKH